MRESACHLAARATARESGWAARRKPQTGLTVRRPPGAALFASELVPLLVVDVWEHAYYIDEYNARPKYLEKFYAGINWEFVSSAYEWAKKEGLGSVKFYIDELHGRD